MRTIGRAGLFGFTVMVAACGSGDNTGGPSADAGLDAGNTADVSEDRTTPGEAGGDASEAGGERDTGAPGDTGTPSDAGTPGDASDAGAADAEGGAITFGDPICTPRSGTRIKARFFQGAEGTRIFDSMYDSTLNVRCSPATTSDGTLRCLPVRDTNSSFTLFSDDKCTMPVTPNYGSCGLEPYVALVAGSTCSNGYAGSKFAMFQLGAEQPDGGAAFTSLGGDSCTPTTFTGGPLYSVSPVPDSTFVDGVVGQVTAGRYSVRTVQYSDGALFCDIDYGFYDSTLQVLTTEAPAADDTTRLVPEVLPPAGFSDGTCTTPATFVEPPTPGCGTPGPYSPEVSAFTADFAACSGVATIRAPRAALDGGFTQSVAPDGGVSCGPAPQFGVGTWNVLSAPLPPATFGETLTQNSGTGRLQYAIHAASGGLRWHYSEAFDTQTGQLCSILNDAPAMTSCTPFEHQAFLRYSDPKCTQPLYVVPVNPTCTAPTATATAWVADSSCSAKILHVGALYTGSVFDGTPSYCYPNSFGNQVVYQGVDDIDQTMFEPLTAVLE